MKIKCETCLNYNCKKIAESGGFRFWGCFLKYLYDKNGYGRKSLLRDLIKEAKKFLPEYQMHWSGGLYCCYAPYGNYVWHYAVQTKQEQIWNHKEFQEGYQFGLDPKEPWRDANPYQEPSRNRSWDCGYILGLHDSKVCERLIAGDGKKG